ncbi:MAG: hypothetical protein LUC93_13220 [Planctomycetaceae bacterium]|nr:hypothetical protein [Planctomycetaceae bacterium]
MTMSYLVLLTSSCLAVMGQLFFKFAVGGGSIAAAITSGWLWSGLASYFCSTMLWLYALSKVQLGVAYAFTSLTFIGVYAASFFILKEPVTLPKIIAIALILTGFLLLAKWG